MTNCILCRFETELDDVAQARASGRCVCLRCYGRVTGAERPMPRDLRRQLIAVLAAVEAA